MKTLPTSATSVLSQPSCLPGSDSPETASPSRLEAAHDAELVRRFNAGDASAFDEIVSRHREKIFAATLAMLRNRADAEEITQDTFIRAYRGLERFRGDSSLATWLHRIALNLARNRYWYFFRRRRHLTLSIDCSVGAEGTSTFADLIAAESPSPARCAATREFTALISACMKKLDAAHREILTHRNLLDRSYDEIAAILGIKVGTVKSRIARARASLRELLAESCPEFSADSPPADWFESLRSGGQSEISAA